MATGNNNYVISMLKNDKASKKIREAYYSPAGSSRSAEVRAMFRALGNSNKRDGHGGLFDMPTANSLTGNTNAGGASGGIIGPYDQLNKESTTSPMMSYNIGSKPPPDPTDIKSAGGGMGKGSGGAGDSGYAGELPPYSQYFGEELASKGRSIWNWTAVPFATGATTPIHLGLDFIASMTGSDTMKKWAEATDPLNVNKKLHINRFPWQSDPPVVSETKNGSAGSAAGLMTSASGGDSETEGQSDFDGSVDGQILEFINENIRGGDLSSIVLMLMEPDNRGLLKQIFPWIPEDELPAGPLSKRLAEIRDSITKDSGINDLYAQRKTMVEAGDYVLDDLSDYILGRDEYVKELDSRISSINEGLLDGSIDLNPYTRTMTKNYLDVMYTLKGRQNKRYLETMNRVVDRYNNSLDRLDSQIKDEEAKLEKEITSNQAISEERYNQISTMLTSMIQNYATMGTKSEWVSELFKNAGGAVKDAADSTKPLYTAEMQKNLDTIFKSEDSEGNLVFDTKSILPKIKTAIGVNAYNPRTVYTYIAKQLSETYGMNNLEEWKKSLIDMSRNSGADNLSEAELAFGNEDTLTSLKSTFDNISGDIIKKYVEEDVEDIKDAFKDLINSRVNPEDSNSQEELSEWWKDNFVKLGPGMVNALWSVYKLSYIRTNGNIGDSLSLNKKPVWKLGDEEATNFISSLIKAVWGYELGIDYYQDAEIF